MRGGASQPAAVGSADTLSVESDGDAKSAGEGVAACSQGPHRAMAGNPCW